MRDPFKIDGPTCISFSGGRTSAYMLWRVLQSNGGGLPDEALVCFANTGKEEEATLRFVQDCAKHWGVHISWVEYRSDAQGYALVDFATASRDGEPFEAIIRKRNYLPNPVTRFCTSELKIRTMHKFQRVHWEQKGMAQKDMEWDQFIGIRADEQRRVSKIRARGHSAKSKNEIMCLPLADAGVTVQDVGAFLGGATLQSRLANVQRSDAGGQLRPMFPEACFAGGQPDSREAEPCGMVGQDGGVGVGVQAKRRSLPLRSSKLCSHAAQRRRTD